MPEWTRPVHYARLIRLHRPIGTVLLAWPMLWALWIAGHGAPDPGLLAVFLDRGLPDAFCGLCDQRLF